MFLFIYFQAPGLPMSPVHERVPHNSLQVNNSMPGQDAQTNTFSRGPRQTWASMDGAKESRGLPEQLSSPKGKTRCCGSPGSIFKGGDWRLCGWKSRHPH